MLVFLIVFFVSLFPVLSATSSDQNWEKYEWEGKQFNFSIPYKISNGAIVNGSTEYDSALLFNIQTNQNSSLSLKAPYHDKSYDRWKGLGFVILLDGEEINPKLIEDQDSALFIFDLTEGNHELELIPMSSISSMPIPRPLSELLFYSSEFSTPLSPKVQFENGVSSLEILCQEKLDLILKIDGSPACVKPKSIPKLIERGWANSTTHKIQDRSYFENKFPSPDFSYGKVIKKLEENERVSAIVVLNTSNTLFDDAKENLELKAKIVSELQEIVLSKLPPSPESNVKKFKYIPGFVITLDSDALNYLVNSPYVRSITENSVASPAGIFLD